MEKCQVQVIVFFISFTQFSTVLSTIKKVHLVDEKIIENNLTIKVEPIHQTLYFPFGNILSSFHARFQ